MQASDVRAAPRIACGVIMLKTTPLASASHRVLMPADSTLGRALLFKIVADFVVQLGEHPMRHTVLQGEAGQSFHHRVVGLIWRAFHPDLKYRNFLLSARTRLREVGYAKQSQPLRIICSLKQSFGSLDTVRWQGRPR